MLTKALNKLDVAAGPIARFFEKGIAAYHTSTARPAKGAVSRGLNKLMVKYPTMRHVLVGLAGAPLGPASGYSFSEQPMLFMTAIVLGYAAVRAGSAVLLGIAPPGRAVAAADATAPPDLSVQELVAHRLDAIESAPADVLVDGTRLKDFVMSARDRGELSKSQAKRLLRSIQGAIEGRSEATELEYQGLLHMGPLRRPAARLAFYAALSGAAIAVSPAFLAAAGFTKWADLRLRHLGHEALPRKNLGIYDRLAKEDAGLALKCLRVRGMPDDIEAREALEAKGRRLQELQQARRAVIAPSRT
jgi:hypothetical protein